MTSKTRNRILLAISVLLLAVVGILQLVQHGSKKLEVCYLNAGKADAILITTGNSAVLIDTGTKDFDEEILYRLQTRGYDRLDCLILTHSDKDHIGGASGIIKNIEVGRVIHNDPRSGEEVKYIKAAQKRDIELFIPDSTYSFRIDGAEYTVYPPTGDYSSAESNNSSLIIRVSYGSTDFLFTGDAEAERLQEYIDVGVGKCDVLKIPHHGAWQDLLRPLTEISGAKAAVITSSEDEPESEKTLALLEELGVAAYLTRRGEVSAVTDGETVTVKYA